MPNNFNEEDLLEKFEVGEEGIGHDVLVGADEVFELGVGTADDWGRGDEFEEEDLQNIQEQEKTIQSANQSITVPSNQLAVLKKNDNLDELTKWAKIIKKILGERQVTREQAIREALPFTHIIAIFNNKNLWVNAQHYLNPANLTYDLGPEDKGWIPILNREASEHIQPFYPPKTLTPRLTQDQVTKLRTDIEEELEAGLTNFRSSSSISTRFAPQGMKNCFESIWRASMNYPSWIIHFTMAGGPQGVLTL